VRSGLAASLGLNGPAVRSENVEAALIAVLPGLSTDSGVHAREMAQLRLDHTPTHFRAYFGINPMSL
jgi:hypothetical protein